MGIQFTSCRDIYDGLYYGLCSVTLPTRKCVERTEQDP